MVVHVQIYTGHRLKRNSDLKPQVRSVGRLTVLGTLFLPASLIASMLSTGEVFLLGCGQFWICGAVTLPLLVMLAVCLFADFVPWMYLVKVKRQELGKEHRIGRTRSCNWWQKGSVLSTVSSPLTMPKSSALR